MALNRRQIGNIFRPQGPKAISLGNTFAPASGGSLLIAGPQIDLSVPIGGFRLVLKFRDVIGTLAMTAMSPLGYLNMISRVLITGKNKRSNGNATLWDIDLPTLAMIQSACSPRKIFQYNGVALAGGASAGFEADEPSTPLAPQYGSGVTGTYDIRIVVDLPTSPFYLAEYTKPGYFLRSQEWGDSLQMRFTFPAITSGAANPLGTDAATTTHTFTAFGSASGSPTLDVYSLPNIMGTDLDPAMVPGFVARVATPISTILQSAGGLNTRLAILEKQNTMRIWVFVGVSTVTPHLSSVSDTNLTTLGVSVGGNRIVRENDDIFAHKQDQVRRYGTQPIQGLTMLDFVQSKNPDSAYLGSAAGEGTTFELRGTVAGVANAYGIVVQEVELFRPEGVLYSA